MREAPLRVPVDRADMLARVGMAGMADTAGMADLPQPVPPARVGVRVARVVLLVARVRRALALRGARPALRVLLLAKPATVRARKSA